MKIIHGDNQLKSREYLVKVIEDYQSKNYEVLKYSGSELTLTALKQACESLSLLSEEKLIIIEVGISKSDKMILDYLARNNYENILIWEPTTVKSTDQKKFPKSEFVEFKLSTKLFEFLDLIGTKSEGKYTLLDQLVKTDDIELIFILTHKRLRQLVYLSNGRDSALGSIEKLATWQIAKLKKQSSYQNSDHWRKTYYKCIEFDWNRKIGKTALTPYSLLQLVI